jgi:hypothetical protein
MFQIKVGVAAVLGGFFAMFVILGSVAYGGFGQTQDGVYNLACTTATVIGETLKGSPENNFAGLISIIDDFKDLTKVMDDGSPFVTDLNGMVDSTVEISAAVDMASAQLSLLSTVMGQDGNTKPQRTVLGKTSIFKCYMCDAMVTPLDDASTALTGGVGSALSDARLEISKQINGENRKSMTDALAGASEPLDSFKAMVRDNLKSLLDGDYLDMAVNMFDKDQGLPPAGGVFLLLLLLGMLCGLFAVLTGLTWAFLEKTSDGKDNPYLSKLAVLETTPKRLSQAMDKIDNAVNGDSEASPTSPTASPDKDGAESTTEPEPKYRKLPSRCACCTMTCTCYFIWVAFFVGGLVTLIALLCSNLCLIMDDLTGETLQTISKGAGVELGTGDTADMMSGMVDGCISQQKPDHTSLLPDILSMPNENGTQETIRKTIGDMVKVPLDAVLSNLDTVTAGNPKLMEQPEMRHLVSVFQGLLGTADGTLLLDLDQTQAQALWPQFFSLAVSTDVQGSVLIVSASCPDPTKSDTGTAQPYTIDVDGVTKTVVGSTTFQSWLTGMLSTTTDTRYPTSAAAEPGASLNATFAASANSGACGTVKLVDCTTPPSPFTTLSCLEIKTFMDTRAELEVGNTFRCDVFEDPLNSALTCDPLTADLLLKTVGTTQVYGCGKIDADGKLATKTKRVDCTLNQFRSYVFNSGTRVEKVFQGVDDSVPRVLDKINVEMRASIDTYLLQAITDILDKADCSYIKVTYGNLIKGLCFQFVLGMDLIAKCYLWVAWLALSMVFLLFGLWRFAVDNVNKDSNLPGNEPKEPLVIDKE